MTGADPAELLRTLARHHVTFVVVGGLAAVLQGAPVQTFDLDVVYALDEANVARLADALVDLRAVFRTDPARKLVPDLSHLRSTGHKLLVTRLGPLDALGSLDEATRYEDLAPDAVVLDVGGVRVQVLGLERLIQVKEALGRPKDVAVLAVLRATLEERRRTP